MVCFKAKKIPLYLQVRDYIIKKIESGTWPVDYKLPSERDLAKKMDVSRKTVSLAYKQLEEEGFLSSQQGRGTFVISKPLKEKEYFINKLLESIDTCIYKALEAGIDFEDFLDLCRKRAKTYEKRAKMLQLIFVECNREQLDYFCEELEFGAGVHIRPILLQDFKDNISTLSDEIEDFDFLITTLFHVDEVRELTKSMNIEIIPIALNPQLDSIIKIARINKKSSLGILAISQNFARKVEHSITDAGLNFKNITTSTTTKPEKIKQLVESVDAIIVSPGRKKDVLPFMKDSAKVIEFIFVPDAGSVNLLKTSIVKNKLI